MSNRLLRQWRRAIARLLAAANLPPPPRPPLRAGSHDWEGLKTRLRWFISRGLRTRGVPALSIALVDERGLRWSEGFGLADRERGIPADSETVYQIGSITKLFTALAVMQLVEQGHLQLDRPITDYVPAFTMQTRWPQAGAITVRALLCHHAGLPTYLLKGFFSGQSLTDLLDALRDEHLAYEPHTVFNYSNLGYDLLGLAIEQVTGLPYAEAVRQQLCTPLGLRHTGVRPDETRLARGYVHDQPVNPTPVRDIPAGGLTSNVHDLARLLQGVLAGGQLDGHRWLDAARLSAMFETQYPAKPLNFGQRFGLGWMLSGLPIENAGLQAWHNGGTKAFVSQFALLPERKLGVVVLANADRAGDLVYEVAEEALRLALLVRDGLDAPTPVPEPEIDLPRTDLQARVGDYSLMGSLARISLGAKRLRLHVLKHVLDLVPLTPQRFRVEYSLLGLRSVKIPFPPVEFALADGRAFALLRDRVVIPAERIPVYSIPASWQQCVGAFHIVNPDSEYLVELDHCRMLIRDDKLLMDIRISGIENRRVLVVVVPFSDTEACVFGLGRNVGDVARRQIENGRLQVRFSGFVFERDE